jgi:hypothetical protein
MIAPPRPPSHDALELLIKEARARQLRRRLIGTAGIAVVAAVGLSVYALTAGGDAVGVTSRPNRPAGVALCVSSQLSMKIGGQAATQTVVGGAIVANTSGSTCSLPPGRPFVRITSNGRTMRVGEAGPGSFASGTSTRMLGPGAKAFVAIRWGNWCGPRASGRPVFQLHFEDGLTVTAPGFFPPRCIDRAASSFLNVSRPLVTS